MTVLAAVLAVLATDVAPKRLELVDPTPYVSERRVCATTCQRRRTVRPYRAWLASTRACESGGNYRTATGNGFWGAYQFTLSSWRAVGGSGMPHHAGRLEQDYRAVRLLHVQGRGAWPVCG